MNTSAKRRSWALEQLRRAQVRVTPVREKVVDFLAPLRVPATLNEITHSAELAGQFDDATVYRTLVLFVELEVVRQIQPQGRATHFLLNMPGECFSFLVCRGCGAITPLSHGEELHRVEKQTATLHGYTGITHELELYGVCPNCQERTEAGSKPTKLISGLRLRRSNN
jgi:Fur family peroxide stress response transcriptional regulator